MLAEGIDTVVLGCTHFPFVIPNIETLVGPGVRVIDPSPAIARQVQRLLETNALLSETAGHGQVEYITTGEPDQLAGLLPRLTGSSGAVKILAWDHGDLRPI
jgi:glutamate racemase